MSIKLKGRPRKYECVEDLQKEIQYYFDSITRDTKAVRMEEDEINDTVIEVPVYNNAGEQVIHTEFIKQPSVVGLCLFINISRETFSQYEKLEEFSDTIHEAKRIIVEQKLEMLPIMKNPRGLMFDLSANYGMHEKTEVKSNNTNHNVNEDVTELSSEDKKKRIQELLAKRRGE
jgi:GTPase SAR1 family protein